MCKPPTKEDELELALAEGTAKTVAPAPASGKLPSVFGALNLVVGVIILVVVLTSGGSSKTTKNYSTTNAGETVTVDIPDFLSGYTHYGENPCLEADTGKRIQYDELGDLDCENANAQSGTNVTKGAKGLMCTDENPCLDPVEDYNAAGMCTVNVHWHIGAEHTSTGHYDEHQDFDHPNKDTYAGSHRRLASADGSMRIGHMCKIGKELWQNNDTSVKNADGSVNEYDWKYCKNMHVGLTYEFHWPHSSLGACQTPWQYQYHFLDGVLCGATMGGLDWDTAAGAVISRAHNIGVEGQVFTIVNQGAGSDAIRPTWDVLNGWDRTLATDVAYYQGSTTGDAANNDDVCRGTGGLVTWHQDRECHTLEASTMDEMCRRMIVISADDMSPDVEPHGARETTSPELSASPKDLAQEYIRRKLRGSH